MASKEIERLLDALNKEQGYKLTRKQAEEQGKCIKCALPYEGRVFTSAGWQETKISKMCEVCWDDMMLKLGEDDGEEDTQAERGSADDCEGDG